MELNESKERLGSLRERETVLLREKGYKGKNIARILRDVQDPDVRKQVERLAKLREEEADKQLKLHEELNPTSEKQLGHQPKQLGHTLEEWHAMRKKKENNQTEEERIIEKLKSQGRDERNVEAVLRILKQQAEEYGITLSEAYENSIGDDV
jgi:ATP-dependent protease HslVU (ClpYQ) ATPase subunit